MRDYHRGLALLLHLILRRRRHGLDSYSYNLYLRRMNMLN